MQIRQLQDQLMHTQQQNESLKTSLASSKGREEAMAKELHELRSAFDKACAHACACVHVRIRACCDSTAMLAGTEMPIANNQIGYCRCSGMGGSVYAMGGSV